MAESYVCSSCGKTHEGLPTDWGYQLPDDVWELAFLERYRRTRSNTDLCTLDERRYFLRGLLLVPFTHREGDFAWGVWVEVPKVVHDFYLGNYSNDLAQGTRAQGHLANAIPGFAQLLGEPVEIEFQNGRSRPLFTFPAQAEHELAHDQRDGIDQRRHHRFLELCGHFDEDA